MKLLTFIILCLSLKATAQDENNNFRESEHMTNLFEYGDPVLSPETNFKNLFKHFPLFVAGSDVKLLTYQFVKRIDGRNGALFFLKRNSDITKFWSGVSTAMGGSEGPQNSFIRLNLTRNLNFTEKQIKNMYFEKCKDMYPDKPALVYEIRFLANGAEHKFYTFVDPEDQKVIESGNIFGFQFPTSYAEYRAKI